MVFLSFLSAAAPEGTAPPTAASPETAAAEAAPPAAASPEASASAKTGRTAAAARGTPTGAAAPAIEVVDTIKRAADGRTAETVDRSALRAVQTPQVFEAGLIRAAVQKALDDGELLTDDCGAVERLGMPVTLTPGSRENLKITTPLDLVLGEAILQARGEGLL